ncbi:bifunctional demethylmenaquinone methyltransferase/2-methoxy-6-polyprenyl-1,4-benzoquinol methylase [Fictibacillus arsenicus]|jgi:demethylmenaquinone methyltransferase / 2-methoxy-6-polyprenyl-1,4-benzoquinol methylase|uniref:Demethylmenaquinone methyltransferase n=1 Tax=Fictibacillus arsenicus TaxID=255247 RepID=A0A1B1Z5F1_9BACL|nr:demethylmenaquinone methyltransferase [Fictibacillus arsenicus]ANX12705.1 bifunctional demethylmenaquinone methyltransferase/2-methoxy-6-polyprenyl-1,4-benzoquinol methylase [Fictibacillus arsenicus]
MLSKEERVHSVFEKISDQYDYMNDLISFKQHNRWRNDTMKRISVKPGDNCLDVCCGTGEWTFALAEAAGKSGHVTGLDFSENMLKVGREKLKKRSLPQVAFVHGNAMELPFGDNTFDVVTIGFGLRNVPDYFQALKEMARVVKPGGRVVCLETSHPTVPIFKQVFKFYFTYIMPVFGKLFAKSYQEYSWLQESTEAFLTKEELKDLFQKSGLTEVEVKSYALGAAAMHTGKKPQ